MGPTRPIARDITVWDVAVAVALTVMAQAELASLGQAAPLTVLLSLAMTVTLVLKRAAPLVTALVVIGVFGGQALLLDPAPSVLGHGLALLVAFYAVGAALGPLRSALLLPLGVVATVVFEMDQNNVGAAAGDMVMAVAAWGVGLVVAHRRRESEARVQSAEDEARQAHERAETALAAERQRVARELHDVVSHAITVVVLQARGAQAVLDSDPERVRQALSAIESSGQEALGEMRRLVIFLREAPDSAPQPDVRDIPALVESARREVPVQLSITGDSDRAGKVRVGHGAGLTAFRVVQECLTNALRHAPGAPVTVRIDHSPTELFLEVANPVGASDVEGHRQGFGLLGMRERAELYGGTLDYGQEGGTWQVRCRLPVGVATSRPAVGVERVP